MGLISFLVKLSESAAKVKGNAPGKSVNAKAEGMRDQVLGVEVYQAPGVVAIPGDGVRGIALPVGGSNRNTIVIAVQNYAIEIDVGGKGGAAIYSTTANGQTVKSRVVCQPDGKISLVSDGDTEIDATGKAIIGGTAIELNGSSKALVTHAELNTALQTFITALNLHTHPTAAVGPPSPPTPMSLNIAGAATTTVKTGG